MGKLPIQDQVFSRNERKGVRGRFQPCNKGKTSHSSSTGFPQFWHLPGFLAVLLIADVALSSSLIITSGVFTGVSEDTGTFHPQIGQNFSPSFICAPQLPQNMVTSLLP
jgi:hypothetical protein